METKRLENFSTFYLDTSEDDIEFMLAELNKAGIDPGQSEKNIMHLIKQTNAEIKLERGRVLKERVLGILKDAADAVLPPHAESRLAVQFRKMDKLDEEDKKEIKKNEALLSEITKLIDDK